MLVHDTILIDSGLRPDRRGPAAAPDRPWPWNPAWRMLLSANRCPLRRNMR
jgi:hypothetical protein